MRQTTPAAPSRRLQVLALVGSLGLPFGAAAAGGWITRQSLDPWYAQLSKPAWTPSGTAIGTVWSLLYTLMGLSAWLVWRAHAFKRVKRGPSQTAAAFFALQLALNLTWSCAFFGLRSPAAGMAVMVPLWLAVLGWARAAGRVAPLAGWFQLPYLAWVAFAALLNAVVWSRNST